MRSVLVGGLWGFVLGGAGLVVASLVTEQPRPRDSAALPDPASESAAAPRDEGAEVAVPEPAPAPAPEVAPDPAPEVEAAPAPVPVPPVPAPLPPLTPAPAPVPPVDLPMQNIAPQAIAPPPTADLPAPEVSAPPAPAAPPPPTVRVNRPGAAPEVTEDPDLLALAPQTPLARYAVDFDKPDDLPMIAILLVDDPSLTDAPALLADLPYAPTIVLNASAPDVTARMRAYRAAGLEVVLQASLPQGAQPADVGRTYLSALALVPEAIAFFADGTGPETGSGAVPDQVMQWIAAEGRGFVAVPRGLGSGLRNAAQIVPMAQVSRTIDPSGDIARGLDQGAFSARQTGQAVVLADLSPAMLEAIAGWADRLNPAQITLVPVSAILLDQVPE